MAGTSKSHVTCVSPERGPTRLVKTSLAWLAVMAVAAVAAQGCAAPVPTASPIPPLVTIAAGVTPRMTVDQVEAIVLPRIHAMEATIGAVVRPARIVSVTATAGSWRVTAEGTFTTNRGPAGQRSPMIAPSGYFVINDADGTINEFGFP